MNSYFNLENKFKDYIIVRQIQSLLRWDHAVMMPQCSHENRVMQQEYLSGLSYNIVNDARNYELIEQAKLENLDEWQKTNLRLIERTYNQVSAIDEKLTKKFAVKSSDCEFKWRTARSENNFKLIENDLQELLDLSIEIAEQKSAHFKMSPYDVLLDSYEESLSQEKIDKIFSPVKAELKNIIEKIIDSQSSITTTNMPVVEIHKQKNLSLEIMKNMGFDFNRGRLDESTHPFCGGYADDIRSTTRYKDSEIINGLMAVIHETGHALYEQNLPKKWQTQLVGSSLGMIIHESQSLLMERQIAENPYFLEYLSKILNEKIGYHKALEPKNIYNHITKVKKSFIRVECDEVTYPMHIILRYEIEKKLFTKEIRVKDIPEIWNEYMHQLLGIKPSTDSEGCLQDIHWYSGYFGYFPCYSLGAMSAAQVFYKMTEEIKNIEDYLINGNFVEINDWLTNNIRKYGSLYNYNELLLKVTDSELDPKYFLNYICNKYQVK